MLAIAGYAIFFSYLTLTRYAAFEARALDMGNLNQAIWNTAHGNWFHLTNQPGTVNRLSLHVEPIIVPIAALYRLYLAFLAPAAQTTGGPAFLVVLQSVVVALGAWPVFALARRMLASAWLGLAFGVVYLLNPSIQAANWLEFHPVTLAPTFLMAAFYFLIAGRVGWFTLFAVLAASCKEEIGLLVFMQGVYALFFLGGIWDGVLHRVWGHRVSGHRVSAPMQTRMQVHPAADAPSAQAETTGAARNMQRKMRRVGIFTMCLALGWSLVAVLGIQNLFADGNIHWGRYGYLGDSPLQMVWSLISRPQVVWAQLQSADALGYIHQLWAPVGYLPLLAPHVFLLALPSLGINLLADFPPMHQVTTLIYAAPIMPFAVLSAVLGAARLRRWLADSGTERAPSKGAQLLSTDVVKMLVVGILAMWVLGAALIQHRAHGYLPTGGNYRLYTVTEHHRRAANLLAQIPPAAAVSAQDKLNPHVSGRATVYIFPRINGLGEAGMDAVTENEPYPPADMIWLDVTGPAWPQHPSDLHASVQELLAGPYGILAGEDGYLLLARATSTRQLHTEPPPEFYTAWHAQNLPQNQEDALPAPIEFGDRLHLLDYAVKLDAHGELVVEFVWQATAPIAEPLGFYVAYRDVAGQTLYDTEFYPPVAQLWYPTEMWLPDVPVRMQTLPWTLDASSFGLYVGVYSLGEPQDEEHFGEAGDFLPITENPGSGNIDSSDALPLLDALPLFEGGTLVRLGGFEPVARTGWQAIVGGDAAWGEPASLRFPGDKWIGWQPVVPDGTPPTRPVDAVFGNQEVGEFQEMFALRGVDVARANTATATNAGANVDVTLYWETLAPVDADYTVFVHLLGPEDARLAQVDDTPHDAIGPRPMTGWRVGETLVDRRHFDLSSPAEAGDVLAESGELRLHIGVYHWSDGARLPVRGASVGDGVSVHDYVEIKFELEN